MRKVLALGLCAAGAVFANPQNPTVVSGDVSFDQVDPQTLHITASDPSIVNWDSFSIDSGEYTKFIQPSASARVLNRVTGGDVSALMGSLDANGKLYLINPNGVIVGNNTIINTASFIASTLDVQDSEFLAGGDMTFTGASTAAITVSGVVKGWDGDVFYIAYNVNNPGETDAPQGTVGIGAGQTVVLVANGDERITIIPNPTPPPPSGTGINSTKEINGMRAEFKADGNIYELAINHTGAIVATGIEDKEGRVILSAEGGKTRVDGVILAVNDTEIGGQIIVLGKDVEVLDNAQINASGLLGGGQLLIGGNIPDQEPVLYGSQTTVVTAGAKLDASAQGEGNGGMIVVLSDGDTSFAGSASAKGGEISGEGGFMAVGGFNNLTFSGTGDARADYGTWGVLYMGSRTLTVQNVGSVPVVNVIDTGRLADNLSRASCGVIAVTFTEDPATLTAVDPVSWNQQTALLYQSDNQLLVNASVSNYFVPEEASEHKGVGESPNGFTARSFGDLTVQPINCAVQIDVPNATVDIQAYGTTNILGGDSVPGSSLRVNSLQSRFRGEDLIFQGGNAEGNFVQISTSSDGHISLEVEGMLTIEGGTAANTDVFMPNNVSISAHGE